MRKLEHAALAVFALFSLLSYLTGWMERRESEPRANPYGREQATGD